MTNLQANAIRLSPQKLRLLWFGLPAAVISGVALLLGMGVLVPMVSALQADAKRLQDLQVLQDQLLLMRQQIASQDRQEQRALAQKDKLVQLIVGSGDISTFLAMLDREAKASGVQLDLYQPQAAAAPAAVAAAPSAAPAAPAPPPPAPGAPPPPGPQADPLEAEGLQRSGMKLLARASYPKLLQLLRRIEELSVLVEQNDLKLELKEAASTDPKPPTHVPPVTMAISFSLYGRPPGGKPDSAQKPPAATPAALAAPANP